MKILKIGGKNLASLAGEFCVDFEQEPLASSGLFAISGPTGAGKTTLLDALCLSLYDATPRLARGARGGATVPDVGSDTVSAQDARTLLRRGASDAHAEVDFVGNDNLRYRARWSVRRSRGKATGALQKSLLTLHQLPGLNAIGGTKTEVANEIVARIGLTFDQFTRAVLLAQNEFSAFLKTDENDRGELLETLTGSAISKRAFERYKAETLAMQQLSARLADHTPMSAEDRCALDAQCAAAASALELADARKSALEQQLRWHQEADKLRENEVQAVQALERALADNDGAGERRMQLALRDLAETARPLQAECRRLDTEIDTTQAAIGAASHQLKLSQDAQQAAAQAVAQATATLAQAESRQREASPELDRAKALDASVAALAPAHGQAAQRRDAARAEHHAALMTLETSGSALAKARAEQQSDAAWLTDNAPLETLAVQWPRWEALLAQAGDIAADAQKLETELAAAGSMWAMAQESAQTVQLALGGHSAQLAMLETARNHATEALSAFDSDQLRAQRERLEARRDNLSAALQHWSALAAAATRVSQVQDENGALAGAADMAQALLDKASGEAPLIDATLAQAERSLKAAELACADSVTDLRANLEDGQPCPVCGSGEHPYKQHSGLLDMLASLRAEVTRARAASQQNASVQATQRALLAGYQRQRSDLQHELAQLLAQVAQRQQAWDATPVALEAPAQEREAWFAEQMAGVKSSLHMQDEQERAARGAARERDAAQQALERAAQEHAAAREQAATAQAEAIKAQALQTALTDKRELARAQLARLLGELDAALGATPDWRDKWRADAARFAAACAQQAAAWRKRSASHAQRATTLIALCAETDAARVRAEHAQSVSVQAQAAFEAIDADIGAQKLARAAMFEGRAVSDVERTLQAAVQAARGALEQQQAAGQQAAQAEARARALHAQLEERLAATQAQRLQASEALQMWLDTHPQAGSLDQLTTLLALDRATLAIERGALQALDAAVATAQAVLAERRQQCELHRQAAPPAQAGDGAALLAALAELDAARRQAHDAATALRLEAAQDDVRRQNSQAMMAQIAHQQQIELRWGRLNELIGSADGKKFRNYAQQFTLDVLLGYANSHLQQLAKRYRLERITSSGGPSLGLLVRDQDMGGEIRSVNSLSGGESFLVSLALALGLASLSSNRVRVESLFIDEGFGSLDSETLRVAMDALDGLQSMGRKVGVISHVQEMTERIATKVLVQPAGGGTSTVTVQ